MKTIPEMMKEAHQNQINHGFTAVPPLSEVIALTHSELSEALESYRNGEPLLWRNENKRLQHMDKPEGVAAEYADVVIRIMADSHARGIDLQSAIEEKMEYNALRPWKHGGKKI